MAAGGAIIGQVGGRRAAAPWTVSFGYRALLPVPLGFLALFFLWPLVRVVWRSVAEPTLGLAQYARLFGGGPYVRVLWLTIETAATVTVICLLLAYPVAYVMARARGTRLAVMTALVLIPLWTSVVIRTYAWMVLFQRRGVLNDLLLAAGLAERPIAFLPGSFGVHVGMVHVLLPFMVLPLVASMRAIDPTLIRAAGVLGARPGRAFVRVFLPLSMPGVNAGVMLVFIMALGFFVTPALLGGPRHMMAAVLIEQQASVLLNWGLASALATVLLAATTAIYLVYLRVTARIGDRGPGR